MFSISLKQHIKKINKGKMVHTIFCSSFWLFFSLLAASCDIQRLLFSSIILIWSLPTVTGLLDRGASFSKKLGFSQILVLIYYPLISLSLLMRPFLSSRFIDDLLFPLIILPSLCHVNVKFSKSSLLFIRPTDLNCHFSD